VDGLSFLSIDANESIWLEREFEEEEVRDEIRLRVQTASQWLSFRSVRKFKKMI